MRTRRRALSRSFPAGAFAVAVLAAAALLPVLRNGFTNWDDDHYLTINPLVLELTPNHIWRYFTSFQLDNYHPLALLAHALWHHLFGLAPWPHHALNLALHAANTALVFTLAGALGALQPGAFAAALLFGVHPLQVETVAWTAQLKTLLATLFFLAALLSYLRRTSGPVPAFPAAALALTACSLLAKPAAVMMPVILLLADRLRGRTVDRRALWEKAPFALLSLAGGGLTLLAQRGALRPSTEQPWAHGPFIATHGILFYLAKAMAPLGLSALYPYPVRPDGGLPWTFLASPVALAILAAALWGLCGRSRDARFAIPYSLVLLAPTLQLIPVGFAHAADRYFYLPSVGLFFLAGRGLDRFWPGRRATPGRRRAGTALLTVVAIALGALSWQRAAVWKDGVTLWSDVAVAYPASYLAWGNLGQALATKGDRHRALQAFERALDLAGDRVYRAKILFDRGLAWQEAGELERAVADYSLGLTIAPNNPRVLVNRGNAEDALGRPREALEDYALAIALDPDYALAWYNRGVALAGSGDHIAAVESFDQALRLEPDNAAVRRHRLKSLEAIGSDAGAQR